MKMIFKRFVLPLLLAMLLVGTVTVLAMAADGDAGETLPDAMVDILADEELSAHKFGTYALENDGYLGIPVDFTFYHDDSFAVDNDYNGTVFIMYVVNTRTERAGTDTDVAIIKSMLERGYIVAVADYHNHKKTTSPDIEWSTQHVNISLCAGKFFTSEPYKAGFKEMFIVPAGHNIEHGRVFWEFDKHSTDGTLEKIVDIWNVDFRGMKGEKFIIPWHNDGVRKEAQNGIHDNSEPVWYSVGTGEGQVKVNGVTYVPDPENGLYLYVKHTKANEITDCVKPDGSPIDLSLYMHVIYPTNPETPVPTLTLASSSEHLARAAAHDGRPHTYGFGFNGYAMAMYDFSYVPMARLDHYGYFDGSSLTSGSITGDNFTYNLFTYNSALVPTAAMRYLRYLAQTEGDTFVLDGNIGVIGNSKGAMITHLADRDLGKVKSTADGYTESELTVYADEYINSFGNYYYHDNHSGETRFDAGRVTYTKDGATIDGGERQPWLTHSGKMIPSNAQFAYSSCGSMSGSIDENFAPFMTSAHYGEENTAFGSNGSLISLAKLYDIPFLSYTVSLGHMFLQRESFELEVDPYAGFKEFVHYFLKNDAPTVLYVTPLADSEISATPVFTVKFAGIVSESEIAKATLTDKNGNAIPGVWTSAFGKTEWCFSPSLPLAGGSEYTLTVPETVVAENGKALQKAFVGKYYTEKSEHTTIASSATLSLTNGLPLTLTVPDMNAYAEKAYNRMHLTVNVTSDAANTLRLYENDTNGVLIDEIPLRGAGFYTLDMTDYLGNCTPGELVTLYLTVGKSAGTFTPATAKLTTEDFEDGAHSFKTSSYSSGTIEELEGHGKVLAVRMLPKASELYPDHKFYLSTTALSFSNLAMSSVGEMDYGRRFTLTFDVYDTERRMFRVSTGSLMNEANGVIDYDIQCLNFTTKAGEWTTVTIEFDNYGRDYGKTSFTKNKSLSISIAPTGDDQLPMYFDNFVLTETVTDVEIGSVSFTLASEGGPAYKYAQGELPFLVNGTAYATLAEAVKAIGNADGTITLQNNVTLTENQVLTSVYAKNITLDLNGYAVRTNVLDASLISLNTEQVKSITVKNGSVYLSGGSLVGAEKTSLTVDVDVKFENVYIGTEKKAMVREVLVNTKANFTTKIRLALDNCTVDMRADGFTETLGITMLPTSSSKVSLSLSVSGGSFLFTRTDKTIFCVSTNDIFFKEYEGVMPVLFYSAGRKMGNISIVTDKGLGKLAKNDSVTAPAGYYAYTPEINELLSTPYGLIPEEYANKDLYPFVVFDRNTYAFIGAADTLIKDSGTAAVNFLNKKTGNYAIYMRRDFTHNNASFNCSAINSDLIIDLGGNTLTYNYVINLQAKASGHNTRLTFKNGTMTSNTKNPFLGASGLTKSQQFHLTFDNVTFGVASGAVPTTLIYKTGKTTDSRATAYTVDVVLKDCTFDMTNVTTATTLLSLGDTAGIATDSATVYGGNIIGNPELMSLVSIANPELSKYSFTKGSDGHYLTNTRLTASEVPSFTVNTPDGPRVFNVALSTNGDYTTYGLGTDPLLTPYGKIPAEYAADPETYAILIFNTTTGAVIWAGNQWGGETKTDGSQIGGALEQLNKNASKGTLAMYFQADVTSTLPYYNFGQTLGTHIIDLNGHTLTAKETLFNAQAKQKKASCSLHLTIKNGTIDLGEKTMLGIGSNNYDGNYGMHATYLFEGVRFVNIANNGHLVRDSISGNFTTTSDIIFRDCHIEFNAGRTNALFLLGSNPDNFTINIKLEGGSIVTGDAKLPTFLQVTNGRVNKTLSFGKGTNGYTTLTVKKISTVTNDIPYKTPNGDRYFALDYTTDTQSVYTMGIKTVYGIIPASYENTAEHPFLIFNLDTKKLVKSVQIFSDETTDSAIGYCRATAGNFVIVLQCDFQASKGVDYNFGLYTGELLFDLGGHTLTLSSTLYYAQAKNNNTMNITTKNGQIIIDNGATLVALGSNYRASSKVMNFVFENVTFRVANSACKLFTDSTSGGFMTASLTFNNCTFISATTMKYAFFSLGNFPDSSEIHITVNGGEFVINTSVKLPIFETIKDAPKHTITFGKYNGEYPTLSAPATLDVSQALFAGSDGVLGLRRTEQVGSKSMYAMDTLNFVSAYLNLASDLNLIYRTYLPFGYTNPVVTFTIGGRTQTVSAYEVDKNGLYLFRLPNITPAEMGKVIVATLTAELDGEEVTVTHDTLSVKSYLLALKAQNADDALLLDLIDKLLVYGAAAQQYLGQNADEFVTEIGTPADIPESENTLSMAGEASDLAAIAKVGMRLDGAFALRITVRALGTNGLVLVATNGDEVREYNLSDYEKVDGEITILYEGITASELGEEITFSLKKDGAIVGKTLTLTPNAYLYRLTANADANLVTLAKATYAYGVSAKAYAAK